MINVLLTVYLINGLTGKIQGVVRDIDTQKPIVYANVLIQDTELGAATDEGGSFHIFNVLPGRHKVEVSCIGYQTKYIENVMVDVDQTVRLNVYLKQTTIEIPPVTVTSEIPAVKKDMVGTTYILRKSELIALPIDYVASAISFQPAVVHTDTALHVRGGRATEVLYLIDNVSIIDPQTGDPAIYVSKGTVDQVIFLPGGFDAEYGRAMSGVINLITSHPLDYIQTMAYGKTEKIMPFYYDFGYQNVQTSVHLPISRKSKGFFSFDVMHTDDWNPKLFILPHKQRDDYSIYGKWFVALSEKLKLTISGAKSRNQFDRYATLYKYHLDHYRSDMRNSDLEVFNFGYLPSPKAFFNMTLSRLYTKRIYGVREEGSSSLFDNFEFRDYRTLKWPRTNIRNPFGIWYRIPYFEGDYPEYQEKSSHVLKTNLSTNIQVNRYHELKAGFEYAYQDFKNFNYLVSDSIHQLIDEYGYRPKEYVIYVQDNVDYEGLYAKIGCRYDYFDPDADGIEPKIVLSPRIGFSFLVTEKFLFRANISRFAQPPLYDFIYSYHSLLPLPSYITSEAFLPPIGNLNLKPEKTISYEIGFQGEIKSNLIATLNMFYKDVSDLIGVRFVNALPTDYWRYDNVEYASIKGIETILEFANSLFSGKISYTLSWAKGTSSYATQAYMLWLKYYGDTTAIPPTTEYYLDFDQRHRIFIQGTFRLPLKSQLHVFGYFGNGFPYTPPGPEGKYEEINILKLPFQKQIDCVITKSLRIGKITFDANIEIINLLDVRNQIAPHEPLIDLEDIKHTTFTQYIYAMPLEHQPGSYYNPAADLNHDGIISPREQFDVYRDAAHATDDWVNAYSEPRRARIGLTINF